MPNHTRLTDDDGDASLTFPCGELPADAAVQAAGHEPNGYFWEGFVRFLAPDLADTVHLDSEAGMFAAYGDLAELERLRALVDSYLDDGGRVLAVVREAERSGFEFDD